MIQLIQPIKSSIKRITSAKILTGFEPKATPSTVVSRFSAATSAVSGCDDFVSDEVINSI